MANDKVTAVQKAVRAIFAAYNTGNMDVLAQHVCDGESDGASGDNLLDYVTAWLAAGLRCAVRVRHLEVKMYGQMALVRGWVAGKIHWPGGRSTEGAWPLAEVWIKPADQWKMFRTAFPPFAGDGYGW